MAPDNVPSRNRHLMGHSEILHDSRICLHLNISGHSEILHGSRMICLPLNISDELQARRGRDSSPSSLLIWYNTHASEEQHPSFKPTGTTTTMFSFGYQSCTRQHSGPFCRKNPWFGCNSGTNLVLFLNILSFNFVQTREKSLRFRIFRRSYVHRSIFVPTNHCQSCTACFCLMCAVQSGHIPFLRIYATYLCWVHLLLECRKLLSRWKDVK